MSIRHTRRLIGLLVAVAMVATAAGVSAHLITYKGTVSKLESGRIQVKTVDDEGKENAESEWFSPTDETKFMRGEERVTLGTANISEGERIVVVVDHRADDDIAVVEVRLAVK